MSSTINPSGFDFKRKQSWGTGLGDVLCASGAKAKKQKRIVTLGIDLMTALGFFYFAYFRALVMSTDNGDLNIQFKDRSEKTL